MPPLAFGLPSSPLWYLTMHHLFSISLVHNCTTAWTSLFPKRCCFALVASRNLPALVSLWHGCTIFHFPSTQLHVSMDFPASKASLFCSSYQHQSACTSVLLYYMAAPNVCVCVWVCVCAAHLSIDLPSSSASLSCSGSQHTNCLGRFLAKFTTCVHIHLYKAKAVSQIGNLLGLKYMQLHQCDKVRVPPYKLGKIWFGIGRVDWRGLGVDIGEERGRLGRQCKALSTHLYIPSSRLGKIYLGLAELIGKASMWTLVKKEED